MTLTALLDLFRHRREGATGVWRLGQEPYRTIFFEAGDIVFAQSTFPADRLTSLLVEKGRLTQAQLDYALANLKQGMSIGKNLIEMGFITQRDLLETARLQVERVVFGAMAVPDESPDFRERDLESSIVRLPLDSSLLLLNGLLGLKDREAVLETLGPLNQVILLHGRHLSQMPLPADLAKLPPFLDGSHTLLELSRESLTEPMRLGAFALFLREVGWAKLHEMPPLDKQALAEALAVEPEPPSALLPPPPLPEPPLDTVPSLFSTIEDAARPTTNLEHLSKAFDSIEEIPLSSEAPLEEVGEPAEEGLEVELHTGFSAESGQAILPTPQFELPPIPEEEPRITVGGAGPSITLDPETMASVRLPASVVAEEEPENPADEASPENRESGGALKWILLVVVILLVAGGGWLWLKRHKRRPLSDLGLTKPLASVGRPMPKPMAPPLPQAAVPPPQATPQQPAPDSAPQLPRVDVSIPSRLATLRRGDMKAALAQGAKLLEERPRTSWTLRLELACQPETVKRAAELFGNGEPDLFVRPMVLQDGRDCYQVFYGEFPSLAAAEKQVSRLPDAFRNHGNRPKPFRLDAIPTHQ